MVPLLFTKSVELFDSIHSVQKKNFFSFKLDFKKVICALTDARKKAIVKAVQFYENGDSFYTLRWTYQIITYFRGLTIKFLQWLILRMSFWKHLTLTVSLLLRLSGVPSALCVPVIAGITKGKLPSVQDTCF